MIRIVSRHGGYSESSPELFWSGGGLHDLGTCFSRSASVVVVSEKSPSCRANVFFSWLVLMVVSGGITAGSLDGMLAFIALVPLDSILNVQVGDEGNGDGDLDTCPICVLAIATIYIFRSIVVQPFAADEVPTAVKYLRYCCRLGLSLAIVRTLGPEHCGLPLVSAPPAFRNFRQLSN